jgi:hypothetical protein
MTKGTQFSLWVTRQLTGLSTYGWQIGSSEVAVAVYIHLGKWQSKLSGSHIASTSITGGLFA